jgi:hypothetical protein
MVWPPPSVKTARRLDAAYAATRSASSANRPPHPQFQRRSGSTNRQAETKILIKLRVGVSQTCLRRTARSTSMYPTFRIYSKLKRLVPVIIVEVLCVISGFPLRPDYPANLSSLGRERRAEVMYVPEMPGSERIMILLTQTRKYLYADCDHAFRAPDRRSVSRDNAVRDSFAAILR